MPSFEILNRRCAKRRSAEVYLSTETPAFEIRVDSLKRCPVDVTLSNSAGRAAQENTAMKLSPVGSVRIETGAPTCKEQPAPPRANNNGVCGNGVRATTPPGLRISSSSFRAEGERTGLLTPPHLPSRAD